jgi:hypothetical protein
MELAGQLRDYLKGKPCKVFPAPDDVRLFYADDEMDNTVVQPDISVICSAGKRAPEACRGAPDLCGRDSFSLEYGRRNGTQV